MELRRDARLPLFLFPFFTPFEHATEANAFAADLSCACFCAFALPAFAARITAFATRRWHFFHLRSDARPFPRAPTAQRTTLGAQQPPAFNW